jgi:hypothetical protein
MKQAHERRTTRILADTLEAHEGDTITFAELLEPLRHRAFGCVLLLLAIPNFIPVPIGIGGIMGTLIVLLGLQMAIGMEQPWIPSRVRQRAFRRRSVHKFLDRTLPVLHWLERLCRPRLEVLTHRTASLLTGLLLVLLGFLLALPIPFTNYLFGVVMLAYAIALIERDGALLLGLWIVSAVILALTVVFSGIVIAAMMKLF